MINLLRIIEWGSRKQSHRRIRIRFEFMGLHVQRGITIVCQLIDRARYYRTSWYCITCVVSSCVKTDNAIERFLQDLLPILYAKLRERDVIIFLYFISHTHVSQWRSSSYLSLANHRNTLHPGYTSSCDTREVYDRHRNNFAPAARKDSQSGHLSLCLSCTHTTDLPMTHNKYVGRVDARRKNVSWKMSRWSWGWRRGPFLSTASATPPFSDSWFWHDSVTEGERRGGRAAWLRMLRVREVRHSSSSMTSFPRVPRPVIVFPAEYELR